MFPNLQAEITRLNVDKEKLAEVIGVSLSNLYARLNGSQKLSLADARKLRDYINREYGTAFTIDYLFSSEPVVA